MIKKTSLLMVAVMIASGVNARTERVIAFIERTLQEIKAPVLKAYYEAKPTAVEDATQMESVVYIDDPRHRRPFGRPERTKRPDYVVVRTYDKETYAHKRNVGNGLIIGGAVLLPAGVLIASAAASNRTLDLGDVILQFLGVVLGAGGLAMLIPGIVLRIKYNKYVE